MSTIAKISPEREAYLSRVKHVYITKEVRKVIEGQLALTGHSWLADFYSNLDYLSAFSGKQLYEVLIEALNMTDPVCVAPTLKSVGATQTPSSGLI